MTVQVCEKETRSDEFEQQLISHMDAMYNAALRLTRNPFDARDLQQDAIVRALRFHHKFEPGTYLRAWLLTIVRNTFINDYRRRGRRPVTVEWTGDESIATPTKHGDSEMKYYPNDLKTQDILEYLTDDVRTAVDSLPDTNRSTVIMADLHDMSYKEIAEALECPLGTVMSRLHRGRGLLRSALTKNGHEPAFG
ncbi:MAG: sigma-70 family RNA polymerase sigma factor [Candidatus Hydrogenedentota bacterium]